MKRYTRAFRADDREDSLRPAVKIEPVEGLNVDVEPIIVEDPRNILDYIFDVGRFARVVDKKRAELRKKIVNEINK